MSDDISNDWCHCWESCPCDQKLTRLREERDRYRKALLFFKNSPLSSKWVSEKADQALSGSEMCPHGLTYCVRCETEGKWSIGSEGER